ncbi:hypothetical protein ACQR1Y_12195 [Bradyrhizobium sp. HKCCYLRH3099]|uniref:hypothetical protein n=1 Tax=unclassified Bradyrhizobium TaxID=2631580 RepID=UPI003EBD8F9E
MTFKGLSNRLSLLKHDLNAQAAPLVRDIEQIGVEAPELMMLARAEVNGLKREMQDLKDFVQEARGSNGGPSLPGSSTPSGGSSAPAAAAPEPPRAADVLPPPDIAAAPAADGQPAADPAPGPLASLDVNGVIQGIG